MKEKESLSQRTQNRKGQLNTDYDSWPVDVYENAVYKTNITVENELLKRLSDDVQKLDFINGTPIKNLLFYWPDTPAFNELKEKLNALLNFTQVSILKQDPFENIFPHKDPFEVTPFYLPLLPLKSDYAPFEFYYNNKQYGIVPREKNNIFVFNNKVTHSVFNNRHTRYNIQFRMDGIYKETYNLLKKQGL